MSENMILAAVRSLLEMANPDDYRNVLNEMFEGWLTSPDTNGADHISRSEKLVMYKQLDSFFASISR